MANESALPATKNQGQQAGTPQPTPTTSQVPPTGSRLAFQGVRRQLNDEELRSCVKIIVEDLERAESRILELEEYIPRYYEAEKRACVLEEKVKTSTAIDVAFGVGTAVGSALLGYVPSLPSTGHTQTAFFVLGLILIGGSVTLKVIKR